jgi:hypothetical protein
MSMRPPPLPSDERLTARRETMASIAMNERETSQALLCQSRATGDPEAASRRPVLTGMNERSSSHIGDHGQMHTFNISKGTWAGSMEIEKRGLWLPAQRDLAVHLPC